MQFTKSVVCSIVTTNGTLGKLVLTSVLRLTTTQHRLASDSNKRIYLIWGIAHYEHNIAFPKSAKLAEKGHIRQVHNLCLALTHGGLQSGKPPVKRQDGDGTGAYNRNHRN